MGLKPNWTEEEYEYLDEHWGKTSLGSIAGHLGRSDNAVKIKVFKRGLGAFLDAGEYVTFNQLMIALGRGPCHTYEQISWIENRGLPCKTKKVDQCSFRVVDLDDFWKWAKENRTFIDFSKVEENVLGKEPTWVKEQRKADILRASKYHSPKEPWTPAEDKRLLYYLRLHKYTYHQLSQMLGRTCGAIQRRVVDLNIKERPIKVDNTIKWTEQEFSSLAAMIKSGMSYELMAENLGKSSKAIRGRVWQTYRTERLDNVIRMIGTGTWGNGTPDPTVKHSFRTAAVKHSLERLGGVLLLKQQHDIQKEITHDYSN